MREAVPLPQPRTDDIQASIDACIANGDRLLDDALLLEFQEPASTRLMVSILAQEEFAKAFLLFLVKQEIIPWDSDLLRVMKIHSCKHLVVRQSRLAPGRAKDDAAQFRNHQRKGHDHQG